MKLIGRSVLLRILSVISVNLYVYAGFMTLRALLFGTYGGAAALLSYLLTAVLGFGAGRLLLGRSQAFLSAIAGTGFVKFTAFMLNSKSSAGFTASFIAWFSIVLPVIASCAIFGGMGALRLLYELLPVIMAYVITLKQSRLKASQIMSNAAVYTGFFVLVLSLELVNISGIFFTSVEYLKPWLFGVSYFFIFAFLVVRNQEDIDSNIFDKKHVEKSILPKNLRSFNTAAVCVVFVAILLLFNLKVIVLAIFHLLGQLSILVMRFMLWLMQNLFPLAGGAGEKGGNINNELFGFGIQPISPLKNLIFNTVRSFVLYYIIYRVILAVIRAVPKVSRRLAALLRKLFSLERGEKADINSDYTDETETVLPERTKEPGNDARRGVGRRRRDPGRIKDPVLRVRYMFSVILSVLPSAGVTPDRSDTPAELARRAGLPENAAEGLTTFAGIYNQVRYGEKVPDSEMLNDAESSYRRAIDAMERRH